MHSGEEAVTYHHGNEKSSSTSMTPSPCTISTFHRNPNIIANPR